MYPHEYKKVNSVTNGWWDHELHFLLYNSKILTVSIITLAVRQSKHIMEIAYLPNAFNTNI